MPYISVTVAKTVIRNQFKLQHVLSEKCTVSAEIQPLYNTNIYNALPSFSLNANTFIIAFTCLLMYSLARLTHIYLHAKVLYVHTRTLKDKFRFCLQDCFSNLSYYNTHTSISTTKELLLVALILPPVRTGLEVIIF